ncbi:MAG: hypothetical protein ACUVXF_05700 [Desulfobaccales bacterium]
MSKFFNFWDALERRYVFNSFLIVVLAVEILIFVVTLIWQIDEGVLGGPVKVVPFPWKEYLFAAFTAPLVLLFLFGVIVRGFQAFGPEEEEDKDRRTGGAALRRRHRWQFFLGLAAFLGLLMLWSYGKEMLSLAALFFKALGLGGTYLMVALVALGALYFPLRLILNYRLKKKALEYQYLAYLAERHGLIPQNAQNLEALTSGDMEATSSPVGDESLPVPPSTSRPNG